MATVEIYTTPICPYCVRAKRLLSSKGVEFTEIDLWQFPARRDEMIDACARAAHRAAGLRGRRALGGSDELHALDAHGRARPAAQVTGRRTGRG